MKSFFGMLLSLIVSSFLLTGCFSARLRPAEAPFFLKIHVVPVVIESPSSGSAEKKREELGRRAILSERATATTVSALTEQNLATTVALLSPQNNVREEILLTGVISLQTALPPYLAGSRAFYTKGTFAEMTLSLEEKGEVTITVNTKLKWSDIRWTRGGPKMRRARPVNDVLDDAIVKIVRLAVEKMQAALTIRATEDPQPVK